MYSALRKRFPLFQLCHNNAKGNLFMTHIYYETVTRKWENICPPGVTLNDAKYTLPTMSDNEESPDDTHDGPDNNRPRPPSPRPPSKRPADPAIASQKPPQRARLQAHDPQGDKSTPRPDKGKQRAGPSLLSVISTSMTPLQPSPRVPESLTTPSAAALAPGQALDRAAPPVSLPSASPSSLTLAPSENHPPSSHVDHPALPIPPTPSQHPDSAALVPRAHDDVSEAPPVPSDVPVSVGDTVANLAAESVAATSLHVPPTQTNSTASKKPRPPRKAPQWPPPSEWAYARHWYKETAGTEADFERHYKAMGPTDRKKAAREYQQ
ncbi:hypothetical protein DICSQDRAFT_175096 [Dichomitus squalens LYAD-421 SS1]|uniref:Uncharacterized protein n=1 Tax=Dichomitus squalens (strain LYAD-421) TaxID=732165 RepID=R7SK78_DICSQ|nr:uncharacterized protein DICSQDRAFT_175096 [Dichomitus squalens LYAD-421 SS1]EJF56243.1 hypothetical protein DICSQDRAFT_175096 [Dichomitus squalens LYAD-421 SS1]